MNHVQTAAHQIEAALNLLKTAKSNLLRAKSDQHIPLAVMLAELEEIHGILTDAECTPDILEGR